MRSQRERNQTNFIDLIPDQKLPKLRYHLLPSTKEMVRKAAYVAILSTHTHQSGGYFIGKESQSQLNVANHVRTWDRWPLIIIVSRYSLGS